MADPASDLQTRLTEDMKAAMRAKDPARLGVIRMLLAEVKNADLQKPPSTPEKQVAAYAKRLAKSREEYEKLGKTEEVAKLDLELAVAEQYLPKQADATQTANLVDTYLAAHPEFTASDVGRATGGFMKEHGGAVDAKAANERIREVLSTR